jgi:hypothetical protein
VPVSLTGRSAIVYSAHVAPRLSPKILAQPSCAHRMNLAARRLGSQTAWQPDGLAARRLGSQTAWQPDGLAARRLGSQTISRPS